MTNAEIASVFEKIGKILTLKDENPFRIRAYDRAALTILSLSEDLASIHKEKGVDGLIEIPGIGQDLAAKIEELVTTGKLQYLEKMQKEVPAGLFEIMQIQGMGPKKTHFVWKEYKVETVADLKALMESGKLEGVKNWGEKSIQNVLLGIQSMQSHGSRVALPVALKVAQNIVSELKETGLCTNIEIAGSVRRRKESIGDIDILVSSKKPEKVMDVFCNYALVERVLGKGETKSSVQLSAGLNADLRVVDEEVFGAALHYFTGSKEHNVAVRSLGIKKGMTINEYGVHKGTAEKKGKLLASRTEEDVYKAVGLAYVPPVLREDRGEVQLAMKGELPVLIEEEDIRGDMHMHSNFSDGNATMTEMAKGALAQGHEYIAITDHGSPMGMVAGIKKGNVKEYLKLIEKARKDVPGIRIFSGTEVDILEDGSLYLDDKVLAQLDWVVAAIHGQFKMSREEMTNRLLKAIGNPLVRMIAHPMARKLLKRDAIDYDIDTVFRAAAKHGVALEVSASVDRLDLNDVLCKRAKDLGVKLVINADAHNPGELDYTYGISQAQRGWLTKEDVLNTLPLEKFEAWLGRGKSGKVGI